MSIRERLAELETFRLISWRGFHGVKCECAICDRFWITIEEFFRDGDLSSIGTGAFRAGIELVKFGEAGLEPREAAHHLPLEKVDVVPLDGDTSHDG